MRFLAALLFALLLAAPAMAQDKPSATPDEKIRLRPFYATINDTAKEKSGRELLEFLNDSVMNDASLVPIVTLWLRENSADVTDPDKLNALYFLSYYDLLLVIADGYRTTGDPEQYRKLYKTAVLNFYMFELIASADAARCQDPTAIDAVKTMVAQRMDDVRLAYKMFPRTVFHDIEKNALRQEEKFVSRPPNVDICSLGKARIVDLSKTPGVMQKTVVDPRFPDGKRVVYLPPPGYHFQPAIMPDDEWLKARTDVVTATADMWAKRYAAATR